LCPGCSALTVTDAVSGIAASPTETLGSWSTGTLIPTGSVALRASVMPVIAKP
jgi:hypothetical protein